MLRLRSKHTKEDTKLLMYKSSLGLKVSRQVEAWHQCSSAVLKRCAMVLMQHHERNAV
jgi:hypothetical protein